KDSDPLREGRVDLETGVVESNTGPELRAQALFRDHWIGVVRRGHPLSKGRVTPARYATGKHVSASRTDGGWIEALDAALRKLGYERDIVALLAGGFATAIALARASDLIATVPARHTANLRDGMHSFELPVAMPEFTISMLWHPRFEADAAHRWLRECVRDVCAGELDAPPVRRGGRADGARRRRR
ncbi:MAG TPA: LysR substrate-binding domain-containing protein, partial [Polyangiales bacterium]